MDWFLYDNRPRHERVNVSTSNALILTENIQTKLDEEKYFAGVFVNLKKPLIKSITLYCWEHLTTTTL